MCGVKIDLTKSAVTSVLPDKQGELNRDRKFPGTLAGALRVFPEPVSLPCPSLESYLLPEPWKLPLTQPDCGSVLSVPTVHSVCVWGGAGGWL